VHTDGVRPRRQAGVHHVSVTGDTHSCRSGVDRDSYAAPGRNSSQRVFPASVNLLASSQPGPDPARPRPEWRVIPPAAPLGTADRTSPTRASVARGGLAGILAIALARNRLSVPSSERPIAHW